MNTEISNTGNDNQDLQERSINTNPNLVHDECQLETIESVDVEVNSDVSEEIDENKQLIINEINNNCILIHQIHDNLNKLIEKMENETIKQKLIKVKDMIPEKYDIQSHDQYSEKLLEINNLLNEIFKEKKEAEMQEFFENLGLIISWIRLFLDNLTLKDYVISCF